MGLWSYEKGNVLRCCSGVCVKHRTRKIGAWHKRLYNCSLHGGGKIFFQQSFILMTVQPFFFASRRVIFEQEGTEETEKFSPLAQFAPVESSGSSVRVRKDKAMHTVGQFHLMEVDEQPNRDIQQLHIAQELGLVDGGRIFSTAFASTSTQSSTSRSNRSGSSRVKPL